MSVRKFDDIKIEKEKKNIKVKLTKEEKNIYIRFVWLYALL